MHPAPSDEHMWRRGGRLIMRSLRLYPLMHSLAMFGALLFVAASIGGAIVLGRVTATHIYERNSDEVAVDSDISLPPNRGSS